ncbi:MAG: pyridoxamine 5'-phosphate oxidase family protein [Acidimicrobiales bacterium]
MPTLSSLGPGPRLLASSSRLDLTTCRQLLASASNGHLAISQGALPVVAFVTCTVDGGDLLVRARAGFAGRAAPEPEVVAFETGGISTDGMCAWEVLVQGRAIAEPATPGGARRSPPQFFVGEAMSVVLRVSMERVTGWRYRVSGEVKEVVRGN